MKNSHLFALLALGVVVLYFYARTDPDSVENIFVRDWMPDDKLVYNPALR